MSRKSNLKRWQALGGGYNPNPKSKKKKEKIEMSDRDFLQYLTDFENGKATAEDMYGDYRSGSGGDDIFDNTLHSAMIESAREEQEYLKKQKEKYVPKEEPVIEKKEEIILPVIDTVEVDSGKKVPERVFEIEEDDDDDDDDIGSLSDMVMEPGEPRYKINVTYMPRLALFNIEDGYISTSLQLIHLFDNSYPIFPIDYNMIDPDNAGDLIQKLYVYIIMHKRPCAIFEINDFVQRFKYVAKRSFDRFFFFKYANYVFAYYIDDESRFAYKSMEEDLEDTGMIIQANLALADIAGQTHNKFYPDEFPEYFDVFEDKGVNYLFADFFLNDPATVVDKDLQFEGVENALTRLVVIDYMSYYRETKTMIQTIIHTVEDDDEEDEEYNPLEETSDDELFDDEEDALEFEPASKEKKVEDQPVVIEDVNLDALADNMMGGGKKDDSMTIKVID